MEPEHGRVGGTYQRVSEQLNNWFMPLFSYELTQIAKSKSASIGSPRGSLGQIPYNCALSDCCDYAVSNGQRHLGALARALDSSAVDPIRDQTHKNRKLILIDLGSGPGLSWLLFTELLLGQSHPAEMTVVNIDHSKNMHLIARRAKEIASSIHPELQSLDFRFATDSKFIDSFTSDELQSDTTILLILNHILHQSSETKEAVPNFVSHALDNISRLAKRSGTDKIFGISIEPARLNIGFGKTGLIQEIHRHHGSVIANAEIAGDRAGKSVTTFSF